MTSWQLIIVIVGLLFLGWLAVTYIPMVAGGKKLVGIIVVVLCILIALSAIWPNFWHSLDAPVKQINP